MNMLKRLSLVFASLLCVAVVKAADPMNTSYSFDECRGSARPYPVPSRSYDYPDSLIPIYLNHVGRHGARYQSSSSHVRSVLEALDKAREQKTITPKGEKLRELTLFIQSISEGRWGALDSLGMAEEWGIAARMYANFPELFKSMNARGVSSYVPRCVMSMYSFFHQLTRLDNHVEIEALSGRRFSPLLRFFDGNPYYKEFVNADSWRRTYDDYFATQHLDQHLLKFLGKDFDMSQINAGSVAMAVYSVVAGTAAISLDVSPEEFYTLDEFNAAWRCFNLRQYLLHSASTLSSVPADIASPLLVDLIETTDAAISNYETKGSKGVSLRFGHAETLLPLFSMMKIDGGYYLTNYFDTVGLHWHDFELVPMAANLQMILFKSESGAYYMRFDINEVPISLISGSNKVYIPWGEARAYLENLLPLY